MAIMAMAVVVCHHGWPRLQVISLVPCQASAMDRSASANFMTLFNRRWPWLTMMSLRMITLAVVVTLSTPTARTAAIAAMAAAPIATVGDLNSKSDRRQACHTTSCTVPALSWRKTLWDEYHTMREARYVCYCLLTHYYCCCCCLGHAFATKHVLWQLPTKTASKKQHTRTHKRVVPHTLYQYHFIFVSKRIHIIPY